MEPTAELEMDIFAIETPSFAQIDQLREHVQTCEANRVRFCEQLEAKLETAPPMSVGLGLHLLGRHAEAIEKLQKAKDSQEKYVYLAYTQRADARYDEALASLQRAMDHQADALAMRMEKVETLRQAQRLDEAQAELDNCGNYENVSAEYHYQAARLLEAQGLYDQAIDNYETAVELSPNHHQALFHLALRSDLAGDEMRAIELYRQIAASGHASVSALLNLAVLYEDVGEFDLAAQCVDSVLWNYPNHARALLFKRDIESSMTMFFDEEKEKKRTRKNQILETPISDFELSVRSRNCLKKMNIRTLGDLLNITEAELLSYKNFGETSLREIKAILEAKGLSLGVALDDKQFAKRHTPEPEESADSGLLAKGVEELQLSVRARKCLQKLNIRSVGELTRTTDAELLGCKNFGVTSLNEINKALTGIGLSLRKLD